MLVQDVLFQEFDTTLISGAGISVFSNVLQCFCCLCNFKWGMPQTGGLGFSSSIWSVITTLLCGCFFFFNQGLQVLMASLVYELYATTTLFFSDECNIFSFGVI